jgi:hypothetical protein
MNKVVTPKQLELPAGKTREELLLATPPRIEPDCPGLKADLGEKVDKIVTEAVAAVLGSGHAFSTPVGEDDFNLHDDDSIVLREQPATAIYHNKHGVLVVRQKGDWDAEHDTFAFITPENAVVFMEALAKVARS